MNVALLVLLAAEAVVSPSYQLSSLCTVTEHGSKGDEFFLDITRNGNAWDLKLRERENSSWIVGDVKLTHNVIKLINREDGSQILFGQSRGGSGASFYSVGLGADVVDNAAVNFSVDVMKYADDKFSKAFERMASADCVTRSGKLGVEGL